MENSILLNLGKKEYEIFTKRQKSYFNKIINTKGFLTAKDIDNSLFILKDIQANSKTVSNLSPKIKNKAIKEALQDILDMRARQMGYLSISKAVGIPKSTIEKYCKELKI